MSTATRWSELSDARMIIPFQRPQSQSFSASPPSQDAEPLTLRQFYEGHLFPVRERRISERTLDSDMEAISAWERFTDNTNLRSLDWSSPVAIRTTLRYLRTQLQKYVRGMEQAGLAASTINKRLRHLRTMLRKAADPIDHALLLHVPDLGTDFTGTSSGWKMPESRLAPRATITMEEMEALFKATDASNDSHLWKSIIVLLWSYGARTEDTFLRISWDLVDLNKWLMRFTANKTSKLQGVPLTPLTQAVLLSLKDRGHSGAVFGVLKKGTWTKSSGWKPGYYTSWSRDILPAGRFQVNRGPEDFQAACNVVENVRPNLLFHHFRKTMVTELNIYSAQAGNWVAAHYMPGVSEQFYDTPTERIAKAVQAREDERLPQCWKDYFLK